MHLHALARCGLIAAALLAAGCATGPREIDRGKLSSPEMQWEPDPLLHAYRQQQHASKEQASGDASAGSGGCGCNN